MCVYVDTCTSTCTYTDILNLQRAVLILRLAQAPGSRIQGCFGGRQGCTRRLQRLYIYTHINIYMYISGAWQSHPRLL